MCIIPDSAIFWIDLNDFEVKGQRTYIERAAYNADCDGDADLDGIRWRM